MGQDQAGTFNQLRETILVRTVNGTRDVYEEYRYMRFALAGRMEGLEIGLVTNIAARIRRDQCRQSVHLQIAVQPVHRDRSFQAVWRAVDHRCLGMPVTPGIGAVRAFIVSILFKTQAAFVACDPEMDEGGRSCGNYRSDLFPCHRPFCRQYDAVDNGFMHGRCSFLDFPYQPFAQIFRDARKRSKTGNDNALFF